MVEEQVAWRGGAGNLGDSLVVEVEAAALQILSCLSLAWAQPRLDEQFHQRASGAFESGAIMMYIAERARKFYPQDLRTKHEVNQWLIWQMANQGPKSGECGHFRRVDQVKEGDQSYAIRRFTDEVNRLYGVLNNRLYKHRYLAGDQYTIADMICYPWTVNWKFQGQDIEEFPYFKRWFEELGARPAVQKGMAVGADFAVDREKLPPEEQERIRKMLYNQRARPVRVA